MHITAAAEAEAAQTAASTLGSNAKQRFRVTVECALAINGTAKEIHAVINVTRISGPIMLAKEGRQGRISDAQTG